jgi:30S ribosomal protein S31
MGKGDKKTRRGKIFMGSFGNTRPRKESVKFEKVEKVEKVAKTVKAEKVETTEKAEKAEKPKSKAKK